MTEINIEGDRNKVETGQSVPLVLRAQRIVNRYNQDITDLEREIEARAQAIDQILNWKHDIIKVLQATLMGHDSMDFHEAKMQLIFAINKLSRHYKKSKEIICERLADLAAAQEAIGGQPDSDDVGHLISHCIEPKDYKDYMLDLIK
jgi:anaerobic ribonucleoside-triphosphate reductase